MHTFSNYSLQSLFVSALFYMDWIMHGKMQVETRKNCSNKVLAEAILALNQLVCFYRERDAPLLLQFNMFG